MSFSSIGTSVLGADAGQVAQIFFAEIARDGGVDLTHSVTDAGQRGGVRLEHRFPHGAGQVKLLALIGKIIPHAGRKVSGIQKAAAEGALRLTGCQTQAFVAGFDGLGAAGIVGHETQIIQRQAGLAREQRRKGAQLFGVRTHALLGELAHHRVVAVFVLGDLQQAGNGGFPLVQLVGFVGGAQHIFLREGIELGADLAALEGAQSALLQSHAGTGNAAVAEGTFCVRAVYDGHQQRGRCRVRHLIRFLAFGVVPCAACGEVSFQRGRAGVGSAFQNGIAFLQQAGHIVHHTGGICAVDDLHLRETAVLILVDVHKAAAGNERGQHGAVKQHIRVVHAIEGVQVEVILPEFPPDQTVGQRVHSLAAPAQHFREGAELRRRDHTEVFDSVFHLIVFVAGLHPHPLLQQTAAQVGHAFQIAHRAELLLSRENIHSTVREGQRAPGEGGSPLPWLMVLLALQAVSAAAVSRPVSTQRQGQGGVCVRLGLFFHRCKQLVAFLSVAPEMRQLQICKVAGVAAFGDWDDVVDARRKRMRKLITEIHRLAADAAHRLGGIDLLFVSLKGQTVCAVPVWARNSLWHVQLLVVCAACCRVLCIIGRRAFGRQGVFLEEGVQNDPGGALQGRGMKKAAQMDGSEISKKPGWYIQAVGR
nr:MAG TPA: hypothetical protein [Caudoviricetes sp.]